MRKLVKKDLKLFFSNKRDMLLTFTIPIIISTIFALVFGKVGNSNGDDSLGLIQSVAGTAIFMLLFQLQRSAEVFWMKSRKVC